jgi:AcrR family transcriptional regulator
VTVRSPGWGGPARGQARERTRDAVVETALRLFNEHGYLGVRVEDIAREAGVSRATFYKYFSEREEILAALLGRLLGDQEPVDEPAPSRLGSYEQLLQAAREAVERMLEQEDLARFVYSLPLRHESLVRGPVTRTPHAFRRIHAIVEAGVAAGDIRDDVPADVLCGHVHGALETAMRDWAAGRVSDPVSHVEQLVDLAFHGVKPSGRRRGRA